MKPDNKLFYSIRRGHLTDYFRLSSAMSGLTAVKLTLTHFMILRVPRIIQDPEESLSKDNLSILLVKFTVV